MDPYSNYKQELEYIEKQKENYTDLTDEGNNSIKILADNLFSKPIDDNKVGVLFDETMDVTDLSSALIELFLLGFDKLSKKSLLDVLTVYDDIWYDINKYFNSIEINVVANQVFDFNDNINLYRDRDDYYCQITNKPPPFLQVDGWYVNNYRIIENKNFKFNKFTQLDKYVFFFINKEKNILRINFEFKPII